MADGSGQQLPSWVSAVIVGAATLLVLLVAVWAASAGPGEAFGADGPDLARIATSEPPAPTTTPAPSTGPSRERSASDDTFTTVVVVLMGVLGLVLVVATVAALVSVLPRMRRRRRARGSDLPIEAGLDPVSAVATAMVDDAASQQELLRSGPPRNAVVLCWHRFEVQAERAGVAREPWETSSEFTLRLLDLVEADASAVGALAGAYREARFSEHELGEDARVRAQESLQRIHHDLRTLLSGGRR